MAKAINSHLFKNLFLLGKNHFSRTFHVSSLNMIQVGEPIPAAELYEGDPGNTIDISELCKGKKVVLFGVPGAFTPGCSRTHLPGYIERYLELKKKGVDEIVCVSVNDVFVMEAWGKNQDATGKVRMLADPCAIFTKAMGLEMDIPKLGGIRSKRYAMVITNGIITCLNVEPDGAGLSCSLVSRLVL